MSQENVLCARQAVRYASYNHLQTTMPSAIHTMTVAQKQWKGDVKAMIADGRLTKVNVVNGKTLYVLDRKKLGMPE